jgi:hypothetical protein
MKLVTRGFGHGASIAAVAFRGYLSLITITTTISPSADATAGGWTPTGAVTLSAAIGETVPNDANFIKSSSGPSFDVCRVQFASPPVIPPPAPVQLAYRVSQDNTTQTLNLTTTLKQGTNIIALWSNDINSAGFTTFTQTLTTAQYAAISDWTNLFLEFDANSPNTDSVALLLTSQLGPNADATHTVYNQPWVRIVSSGAWIVGDTIQLIVNGVTNSSVVLTSINVSVGYVDVQVSTLAAATYSVQSCIVRSGNRSALTPAATFTIFPYAFDGIPNLYAAHGVQRMLTSYAGPLAQIIRTDNSATYNLFANPDGYIDMGLARMLMRGIGGGGVASCYITKLYDQSGNSRDATPVSSSHRPRITFNQNDDFTSGIPDYGIRGQCYIAEFSGFTQSNQLTVSGMGGVAQAVNGLSLAMCVSQDGTPTNANSADRSALSISVNGGTGRRAAMFTRTAISGANVSPQAGGRRQDIDSEADTNAFAGIMQTNTAAIFSTYVARFDYQNAVLKFSAFGNATTLTPFETAGQTDNTSSDNIRIGGNAALETANECMMGLGWFQRALTDTETSSIINGQLNYHNIPPRPLIHVGVILSVETFRTALITKIFNGPPYNGLLPTGGFTTVTTTTDPLIAQGFHPANLDHYEANTMAIKNDVGTTIATTNVSVWYPNVGSRNGKLIVYCAGTEGNASAGFNDPLLVQTWVVNGYTVASFGTPGGSPSTLPGTTATLTPYRYYCEPAIKIVNALQGTVGLSKYFGYGFSAGAPTVCVVGAVDIRFSACISHDQNMPVWANSDDGDWHQAPGVIDLNAQTNCDFPDLWLLCITGNVSVSRTMILSFSDTQSNNQSPNYDWFAPSLQVSQIYKEGQFGYHFDAFTTGHSNGQGTIDLSINIFGRY